LQTTAHHSAVSVTATAPLASSRAPATAAGLPSYARGLLSIQVPITVALASKKQRVAEILELGPGSIIQFEKSCDEMLDLFVGNRCIAQGEAVKVGDKFGLRLMNLVPPGERLESLRPAAAK